MSNALPYYKRFPRDLLEGTAGMPFEEKAAYALLLDLIYLHNGRLADDPRFIGGLLGLSVRKWKTIRAALIERGKIIAQDGIISNFRADKELEIQRSYQDKQAEKARGSSKNNDLEKPRPSHRATNQNQNHKDDDEDAGTDSGLTFREKILIAMGHDPSGMTATGRMVGNPTDMLSAQRWTADLGLSETEIVTVVKATASGRPPIGAFRYFDQPMQQFAAAKSAPALKPVHRASYERPATEADERQAMTRRVLAKFAEGIDA